MKTIIISIGNSDNKLSQEEWANFVAEVNLAITDYQDGRYFFGGSSNWERWQNACWWVECQDENSHMLKGRLTAIRRKYSQDSIAWLSGEVEFI